LKAAKNHSAFPHLQICSITPQRADTGGPLEPPAISPARGPPTDWGELVQIHNDRDIFQTSPHDLPAIDIHSLRAVPHARHR
jgi:hypothetical protein